MILAKVLDCQKKTFVNRETGKERTYFVLCCSVDEGGIGFVSSNVSYEIGDAVELELYTDRNHKFAVGLAEGAR